MKTHEHAAQLAKALKGMQKAADEIANEFIHNKRAANWGVINDAYVAANRAIAAWHKYNAPPEPFDCVACGIHLANYAHSFEEPVCLKCVQARRSKTKETISEAATAIYKEHIAKAAA